MEQNEGQQPAVVLKDTEIRGDVSLRGWLRLFGNVSGNVRSGGRVEVMAGAVVEGTVECRELYVEGEIGGDARAEVMEIGEGGVVRGEAATALLRMRGRRYGLKRVRLTGK